MGEACSSQGSRGTELGGLPVPGSQDTRDSRLEPLPGSWPPLGLSPLLQTGGGELSKYPLNNDNDNDYLQEWISLTLVWHPSLSLSLSQVQCLVK